MVFINFMNTSSETKTGTKTNYCMIGQLSYYYYTESKVYSNSYNNTSVDNKKLLFQISL